MAANKQMIVNALKDHIMKMPAHGCQKWHWNIDCGEAGHLDDLKGNERPIPYGCKSRHRGVHFRAKS
jgi:hypothetical protein